MATVNLIRRDDDAYRVERTDRPATDADVYAVEVDDETLARWDDAEEMRREAAEAYREAMAPVWAVEQEIARRYDEAEDAHYASLPPRDPDAPPPGPIRDLFPVIGTKMVPIEFPRTLAAGDTATFEGPTTNLTES